MDGGTRNVGCRIDVSSLTTVSGDLTVSPGTTYEGLDIYGRVTGTGDASTVIRDCIIRGQSHTTSQSWSARGGGSGTFGGALFEWCTFDQRGRESAFANTFEGGGFTARYCDIMRTVDGAEINAVGGAVWQMCRFSHGVYFSWWNDGTGAVRTASFTDYGGTYHASPFPAQSSGDAHSDGIQAMGWTGNVIQGCSIGAARPYTSAQTTHIDPTVAADYAIMAAMDSDAGFANAAVMVNGNAANPHGLLIELNWLAGGTATVNLAPSGSDLLAGVTVRNNIFDRPLAGVATYSILNGSGSLATISGNTYRDDGTPVTVTNL